MLTTIITRLERDLLTTDPKHPKPAQAVVFSHAEAVEVLRVIREHVSSEQARTLAEEKVKQQEGRIAILERDIERLRSELAVAHALRATVTEVIATT